MPTQFSIASNATDFSFFLGQYPLLPLYSKDEWQPVLKTSENYHKRNNAFQDLKEDWQPVLKSSEKYNQRNKKFLDYYLQDSKTFEDYEDYNSVYYEFTTTKSPLRSFDSLDLTSD